MVNDGDYELVETYEEPDLFWVVKKYLEVSPGKPQFEELSGYGMTNDYEKWKDIVDTPLIRQDLEYQDDVLDPFENPRYARDIKPFGSGVGDFYEPATSIPRSQGLMGATSLPEEEGLIGLAEIVEEAEYGLGETAEQRDARLAKEPIKWKMYSFTKFPGFSKSNKALKDLQKLPPFFKNTEAAMKKSFKLPTIKEWKGKISYPLTKAPSVQEIDNIAFKQIPDIEKYLKKFQGYITTKKFSEILTAIKDWGTYAYNVYPGNPFSSKETPWTNIKRARRKFENAKKWMDQTKKFGDGIYYMLNGALKNIDNLTKKTVNLLIDAPTLMNTAFKSATNKINNGIKKTFDNLKETGSKYSSTIKKYINGQVGVITEWMKSSSNAIKEYTKKLFTALQKDLQVLAKWLRDRMKSMITAITGDLEGIKDWITQNLTGLSTNIKTNVFSVGDKLELRAKVAISKFQSQIEKTKAEVKKQFDQTIGKAKQDLTTQMNVMSNKFKADYDKLSDDLKTRYDGMKTKIDAAIASLDAATKRITSLDTKLIAQEEKLEFLKSSTNDRLTKLEEELQAMIAEKSGGFQLPWG